MNNNNLKNAFTMNVLTPSFPLSTLSTLYTHLINREIAFAELTSFGSFIIYILTPIPSLLRKEGRGCDKNPI
jgi:hypothetical protein